MEVHMIIIDHIYDLQIENTSESDPRSHSEASHFFLGFLCNCFSCLITVRIIFTNTVDVSYFQQLPTLHVD